MTVWKKTKLMLGLAADEEYDDGYDDPAHHAEHPDAYVQRDPRPQPTAVRPAGPNDGSYPGNDAAPAHPVGPPPNTVPRPRPAEPRQVQRSVVRPIPAATTVKPHVMTPTSFNDAQEIGDKYKGKQPVIMNIQELDRDLSRRLIDFASGLCYGIGGRMEKVADHVYMLTPSDVEVSPEERQRLRDRGLHDE